MQSNSNIIVYGALTVSEWQAGWNSKYTGKDQISVSGNEINGYSYLDISSKEGYNNTLYFPHKSIQSNCNGYWLCSHNANNDTYIMYVSCSGYVDDVEYNTNRRSIRPAIRLASSINIEQDSTTGIWSISNQ